jgi:hypothetical protein
MAVAYRLVPMFLVSEVQHPRRALASLLCVHAGVPLIVLTIATKSPWKPLAALPIAVGFALYAWELASILAARRRLVIDWALRAFLVSQASLAPAFLLGLALSWPGVQLTEFTGGLEGVYGTLAILAIPALAILGMLHKILPFLVWYGAYSRHLGTARTPAVHEMYSPFALFVCIGAFLVGLGLLCIARLQGSLLTAQFGVGTLAVSMLALTLNCVLVLRHLVRPVLRPIEPLPSRAPAPTPTPARS